MQSLTDLFVRKMKEKADLQILKSGSLIQRQHHFTRTTTTLIIFYFSCGRLLEEQSFIGKDLFTSTIIIRRVMTGSNTLVHKRHLVTLR